MSWWKKILRIDDGAVIDKNPVFLKYCELIEERDSVYELEALQLIKDKKLSKVIGDYLINHQVNGLKSSLELSRLDNPGEVLVGEYWNFGTDEKTNMFYLKSDLAKGEAFALVGNY
jgi:hypothetical protein